MREQRKHTAGMGKTQASAVNVFDLRKKAGINSLEPTEEGRKTRAEIERKLQIKWLPIYIHTNIFFALRKFTHHHLASPYVYTTKKYCLDIYICTYFCLMLDLLFLSVGFESK